MHGQDSTSGNLSMAIATPDGIIELRPDLYLKRRVVNCPFRQPLI